MAKHYYDPMLCTCSQENPMTMGVTAVLTEEIDAELLKEAAQELRERFAYFYVRAKIEDNDIVVVPNPLPMTVRNTWAPIELASKEANYHLAAIKYEGNRICLEMNHTLSDGAGVSPFLRACYLCIFPRKQVYLFLFRAFVCREARHPNLKRATLLQLLIPTAYKVRFMRKNQLRIFTVCRHETVKRIISIT